MILGARLVRSAVGSKLAYSKEVCDVPSVQTQTQTQTRRGGLQCIAASPSGPRAFCLTPPPVVHHHRCKEAREDNRDEVVVVFRGTSGLADVRDLLNATTAEFRFRQERVRVHAGMLSAFSEMEAELTDALLRQRPAAVTFAGHSKGGCHAQFAAAYYKSMLGERVRVSCHTVGALAAGDRSFTEWYCRSADESVLLLNRADPAGWLSSSDGTQPPVQGFSTGALVECPLKAHDMDTYLEHVLSCISFRDGGKPPPGKK